MYCKKCGKEISDNAKICPECGVMVSVSQRQPENKPVSAGEWFVTILLTWIPLVGFIMMFVWAFGGGVNPSKKNWARANLIWWVIAIALSVIFGASLMSMLAKYA